MNGYEPGDEFQCLSLSIAVVKTPDGAGSLRSGFSIAGGIDQDYTKSPQKFTEAGVYITRVDPNGAGARAGLKAGDRILECNKHDFTLVTHKQAVEYIKRDPVLELLIIRKDDCVNVRQPLYEYQYIGERVRKFSHKISQMLDKSQFKIE